ncbi:MAG: FecR family protein [Bacteroidota bacterium]
MTNHTIWKLVQQYVTGNISPSMRRELERWALQHPDNKKLLEEVTRIWELSPEEDFDVNVQDMWESFYREQIEKNDLVSVRSQSHHHSYLRSNGKMKNILRAAAVVLVSVFAGYFTQTQLASEKHVDSELASDFYLMQELVTSDKEKASIIFSDGTEVILNASSSLRFPKQFNGSVREIQLDGEAYFNVARNPDSPFIVHTRDAAVEVLGTKFNVQAWSEDVRAEIVVREGKVSVASESEESGQTGVVLNEGEFTQVSQGKSPVHPQKVNSENYLLWTEGGLHFDNTPLQDVFRNIERRFQVDITVHDEELLMIPFTSTFYQAELNEILTVIAASMKLEYLREGSKIEFSNGNNS